MNEDLKRRIEHERSEISEYVYRNMNFLIKYYSWSNSTDFFNKLNKETGISTRTINSWYYKERLPPLDKIEITLLTSYLNIKFSDLISKAISINDLSPYQTDTPIPSEIAKENILNLLVDFDIQNPEKFEAFFEGNYSKGYFYKLQSNNSNPKNISWNFVIASAHYFNMHIGDLFKIKEDSDE